MNPKLTDDAVSRLPLEGGRTALLEEIVGREPATAPARTRRWVAPLAAAAVVAGIAGSSLWWSGDDPAAPTRQPDTAVASDVKSAPTRYAVLDAPGWEVTYTESYEDYGSASYENGGRSFEITTYPADSYAGYVEDREHIVDPAAPGEPVEVLGLGGQMWAYSRDDHTTIREVEAGHFMELRGSGMDESAYVALLGRLRMTDLQGFEASLPDEFVTGDERASTAEEMLAGITDVAGAGWPASGGSLEDSDQQDRYQLGAEVVGDYACAWLGEYVDARAAGDAARAAEAVRVMGTSRQWPVLKEMDTTGDYPEVLWDFADQVAAGQAPEGYRGALGC